VFEDMPINGSVMELWGNATLKGKVCDLDVSLSEVGIAAEIRLKWQVCDPKFITTMKRQN
jgi:hypothetical protein